jgi:hypothetical protein
MWGTTNNKPLGPIIMMSQSETLSQLLDHIHYTLFCSLTAPFTSDGNLLNYVCSAKPASVGFSSSNCTV